MKSFVHLIRDVLKIVGIGCAIYASTASLAVEEMSEENLTELTKYSVALVMSDRAWGTGFFVTGKVVITNHHIVASKRDILVKQRHNEVNARVYWSDARTDLAVVLLDDAIPGSRQVTLSSNEDGPTIGARAFALGLEGDANQLFDLNLQVVPTPVLGQFTQLVNVYGWPWIKEDASSRQRDDLLMLQHSASVTKGYSGGPLFDFCGRVVGVITMPPAGVEGVNYASGINELVSKLESERLLNRQLNRLVIKDDEPCVSTAIAPVTEPVVIEEEPSEIDELREEISALQQTVSDTVDTKNQAVNLTRAYQEQMARLREEIQRGRQAEVVNQQALDDLTKKLTDLEEQNITQLAVLQQSDQKLSDAETQLEVANEALRSVQSEVETIERESQEERARLLTIIIIVAAVIVGLFLIALVLIASLRKKVGEAMVRARDSITRVAARRGSGSRPRPSPESGVRQIRIGRGRDMDYRFDSDAVSRYHAELEVREGKDGQETEYLLRDIDSANGTRISRDERWEELKQGPVQLDDMIQFGDQEITIRRIVEQAENPS